MVTRSIPSKFVFSKYGSMPCETKLVPKSCQVSLQSDRVVLRGNSLNIDHAVWRTEPFGGMIA